ncbi:MAG: tRNA adenosine(34) deaminase TadA [Candidatus Acidiferrales bacterium]
MLRSPLHGGMPAKVGDILWGMPEATEADLDFMRMALEEARLAAERGEVPIGAVIVMDGLMIARAGNRTITDCDPTAHAEIVALREAARKIGNHRLIGSSIYVTVEPCAMCAGALVQSRAARLIYGAEEPKGGAVRSCFAIFEHPAVNHRVEVTSNVLAADAAALLKTFFLSRR